MSNEEGSLQEFLKTGRLPDGLSLQLRPSVNKIHYTDMRDVFPRKVFRQPEKRKPPKKKKAKPKKKKIHKPVKKLY
tara:strand:+ start:9087 stop:9314 length:228 start_codon:yes stop_codon:yes gene_type:complete